MRLYKLFSKHLLKTLAGVMFMPLILGVLACSEKSKMSSDAVEKVKEKIQNLNEQGETARKNSRFDQAIKLHTEQKELAESIGDTIAMVTALNNIGTNYRRLGSLENALHSHHQALLLSVRSDDQNDETVKKNRLVSLNGLGNIYLTMGNLEMADSAFRQSLSGEKALGSALGQAINLANIGSVKEKMGQIDSAWIYYRHSLAMNKQVQSKLGEALCFSHFASLHEQEGKYSEAIEEYRHAYEVMADSPDDWHKLKAGVNVAKLYIQQGDFQRAMTFLQEVDATARRINSIEHRSTIHHLYYLLYEKKGDVKAAFENYKESTRLKDSLINTKDADEIQNMRMSLEREQQQNMLKQANERYQHERFARKVTTAVLACLLLVATAIIIFQRNKIRKITQ